jgi:hypothetical protein
MTPMSDAVKEGDGVQADSPVRYSSLVDRTIDGPVKWETKPRKVRQRKAAETKIEARNAIILIHHQVTQQHLYGASDASESRKIQSEDSNTAALTHSTYPRLQSHDDYSTTGPVIRLRPTSAPRSTPTAVGSKQLPDTFSAKAAHPARTP